MAQTTTPAAAGQNDDIGEATRLELYRSQVTIREAEQRAFDLFLQNLVKGTSSDCHAIILGFWPSLVIGAFGVVEIIVDPYALKKQGQIEVTSFQLVDVASDQLSFCVLERRAGIVRQGDPAL